MSAATIQQVYDLMQKDFVYKEVLYKYFPKKDIRDEFNQELILYIFEHPERIIEVWNSKSFKYYYIGLVKNQVLSNDSNWHNKFRKPQQQLIDELPEQTEEPDYFEEEEIQEQKEKKKIKLRIIEQAIAHFLKLNPKSKSSFDIFKLYYYENLSIREISKRFFNTPPTTIFDHLKEAEVLIKWYVEKYNKHIKN